MTSKIFDTCVVTTDLHLGKKNNDKTFLDDCRAFIEWSIDLGKKHGADTYIHLGDWHDNRKLININTLNLSIELLEKIAGNFKNFYLLLGNHDLFYKERRCVNSVEFAKHVKNLTLVKDYIVTDQCAMFSWLLPHEKEILERTRSKYVFGHFELSGFLTNNRDKMPDVGFLSGDSFHSDVDFVFSGHFHRRQHQKNKHGTDVYYIGNCFPHNFSDANDLDRGAMILRDGEPPRFYNWEECPYYYSVTLSGFLSDIMRGNLRERSTIRCTIDLDVNFDRLLFIKDMVQKHYPGIRDIHYILPDYEGNDPMVEERGFSITPDTIENIIAKGLEMVESPNINRELLLEIYRSL